MTLTSQDMKEFLHRGFSRRNFGQIATVIAGLDLPDEGGRVDSTIRDDGCS